MKTWTVVIEITEKEYGPDSQFSGAGINEFVAGALRNRPNEFLGFRIMETIPAPYGPQHPDGVWISEHNKLSNAPQRLYQPKVKP